MGKSRASRHDGTFGAGMGLDIRYCFGRALNTIFPKARLALAPRLAACLATDPLRVIDVGGAMGPDRRWAQLPNGSVRFMTFEPDARSQYEPLVHDGAHLSLPIGLADKSGERTLHLTEGPFASSLYRPNEYVLRDFAIWPWYVPAGTADVKVDTLDACVARVPDWRADFVKIDAEGADLDVLKGGRRTLETAFGVQIEVAFAPRNVGAPLQPEMDLWLREAGFIPHLLIREHWVRANRVYGALSQPQLIWADAVYFRDRAWTLEQVAGAASRQEAETRFCVILAILLAHNAHDYAAEIVAALAKKDAIAPDAAEAAHESVSQSLMPLGSFAARGTLALLLALIAAAPLAFFGTRGRAVGRDIIAAQAGPLFDALLRWARRGGLDRSCVTDL
jgi:FkbM family methyltransferase